MILNTSCEKAFPIFKDKAVQCVITSPPYCTGKKYEVKQTLDEYLSFYPPIIKQLKRILHETGSIFWQVGNFVENGEIFPLDIYFYNMFKAEGFQLRNRIIWHFGHGLHCKHRFSGRYETILFFTKSDNYIFNLDSVRIPSKYPNKKHYKGEKKGQLSGNPLGKNPSDVWSICNVKHNHPEKTIHPCSFPMELCRRCILVSTNPGDIVLDPFCGTGAACMAAKGLYREYYGIDTCEEYCTVAKERLGETC